MTAFRRSRPLFATILAASVFACTPHRRYFDAELSAAAEAARAGYPKEAEERYTAAVSRAKSHLDAEAIAFALHDMGIFYRRHGRPKNAVVNLEESLVYASEAGSFDELEIGKWYVELAGAYAALNEWERGVPLVRRVVPYWERYQGEERQAVAAVFAAYRDHLVRSGQPADFIPGGAP